MLYFTSFPPPPTVYMKNEIGFNRGGKGFSHLTGGPTNQQYVDIGSALKLEEHVSSVANP